VYGEGVVHPTADSRQRRQEAARRAQMFGMVFAWSTRQTQQRRPDGQDGTERRAGETTGRDVRPRAAGKEDTGVDRQRIEQGGTIHPAAA